MATDPVVVTIKGLDDIRRRINQLKINLKTLRRPNREIGNELLKRHAARMQRGQDIHGRAFKRSRLATARGTPTLGGSRGSLSRSVGRTVADNYVALFTTHKAARVHQEGATITPKRRRWLTIPLRFAGKGGAGVGYYANTGDLTLSEGRKQFVARSFSNTFFRRVRGNLFLFQKTSKNTIRALFVLKKSVTLPKREWFGLEEADGAYAVGVYSRWLSVFDERRERVLFDAQT